MTSFLANQGRQDPHLLLGFGYILSKLRPKTNQLQWSRKYQRHGLNSYNDSNVHHHHNANEGKKMPKIYSYLGQGQQDFTTGVAGNELTTSLNCEIKLNVHPLSAKYRHIWLQYNSPAQPLLILSSILFSSLTLLAFSFCLLYNISSKVGSTMSKP